MFFCIGDSVWSLFSGRQPTLKLILGVEWIIQSLSLKSKDYKPLCVLIFIKNIDKKWDHPLAILFRGKIQSSIILFSMKNLKLRYVCLSIC